MNEQIQQVIEKISQAVQESPETVEAAIQNGGEEGFKQVVTSLQKGDVKSAKAMIQKLATRKAAHGAKLNYFRKLKNQCPEGEELYYYKKGGKAGCGCRKKEDGGEVEMAKKGTAVEKFKKGQFGLRTNELVKNYQDKKKEEEKKKKANTWGASTKYIAKPKNADPKKMPQDNAVPNEDIPSHGKKANKKKCGGKVEKDCGGAVAKFKAKCGSKLKKHQQGGSLNGIPFYQGGTVKQGIEKQDKIKVNKPIIPYTLVQPQQLSQITIKGIRRANLPGITVVGQNLSKSYPFPYGGINVVSKSINGGLDRKQRVFINPFDKIRN